MSTTEEDRKSKTKPQITIREMDIDDFAAVYHLGERLFTASEVPNLYRTWDEYEVMNLFQYDREFCLVAEFDDKIVGFALGTTIEKPRSAWKYGHMVWLGVSPEFQQSGVGARLFNHIKDLMTKSGVRILMVDTEADNLGALNFFRKVGFRKPEEHIYLSLNLSAQKKNGHTKKIQG